MKLSNTGDGFNKDLFYLNNEDDASTEAHLRFSSESKTVPKIHPLSFLNQNNRTYISVEAVLAPTHRFLFFSGRARSQHATINNKNLLPMKKMAVLFVFYNNILS